MAYGTETSITATRLNSAATGTAFCLPAVSFSTSPPHDCHIWLEVDLNSTGVDSAGYLQIYVVESTDGGTDFTDNIDPTSGSDQISSIKNAKLVAAPDANANSQVVEIAIDMRRHLGGLAKDWAVVVRNESGAALAASGHAATYRRVDYD